MSFVCKLETSSNVFSLRVRLSSTSLFHFLKYTSVYFRHATANETNEHSKDLFKIEGKVLPPESWSKSNGDWKLHTEVLIDGGDYRGQLKDDGTFTVFVPSGSYIVEIVNPAVYYEPVRVDITSKGKFRARKVNHIQPNAVNQLTYPLKFKSGVPFRYFQQREQWRITDFLFSPMVLMMFLPLVLIYIIPKMMNDPETRKEMENLQMPKYDVPEMSEMLTSFFGGGDAGKKAVKTSKTAKRKT